MTAASIIAPLFVFSILDHNRYSAELEKHVDPSEESGSTGKWIPMFFKDEGTQIDYILANDKHVAALRAKAEKSGKLVSRLILLTILVMVGCHLFDWFRYVLWALI